jgi:precorrin-6B methylase 2
LRLIDGGEAITDAGLDAGMVALVRVNSDRLCLDAVELADGLTSQHDTQYETRVTARFIGAGRGAARLGIARGFEFHQPLSCGLSGSR